MPGAVLEEAEIDENGDFVFPNEPLAETPMSKATPMSKNAATPNQGAFPWTGSHDKGPASSSAVRPSQTRQRQHTQQAKKSFLDADFVDGRKSGREDDDFQGPQAATTRAASRTLNVDIDSVRGPEDGNGNDEAHLRRGASAHSKSKRINSSDRRGERGDDEQDDEHDDKSHLLQHTPARGACGLIDFDTDSVRGRDKDDEEDETSPTQAGSAHLPAKKGTLNFSSTAPSAADSIEKAPPKKASENMRGKSALAVKPGPLTKKPTDRPKSTSKSTAKVRLNPLSLEVNDEDKVGSEHDDPFNITNMPSSGGLSPEPAGRTTKRASKRQPAAKQSKPSTQNKKRTTKPSPEPVKSTKLRQKAKPSAAEPFHEPLSPSSKDDPGNDARVPNESDIPNSGDAEELVVPPRSRVLPQAFKSTTKQRPTAIKKIIKEVASSSEQANSDPAEGADGCNSLNDSGSRAMAAIASRATQTSEFSKIGSKSVASKSSTKDIKAGVSGKVAKRTADDNDEDWIAPEAPPKKSKKTAPLPSLAPETELVAKSQLKTKTSVKPSTVEIAPPPPDRTSTTRPSRITRRTQRLLHDLPSTDDTEIKQSSKPAPKPAKTARQAKTQPQAAAPPAKSSDTQQPKSADNSQESDDVNSLKDTLSAVKQALTQPARTARQTKTQLTSASNGDHVGQGGLEASGVGVTEPEVQHRKPHQCSQKKESESEDVEYLLKSGTAQNESVAPSTKNVAHSLAKGVENVRGQPVPEVVKDKERKVLIIPFGTKGPTINGISHKKPNVAISATNHHDSDFSSESNSSDAVKIERHRQRGVNGVKVSKATPDYASHTSFPRSMHTQKMSVQHATPFVQSDPEGSGLADCSKQERIQDSRSSQCTTEAVAHQLSAVLDGGERSAALLRRSSIYDASVLSRAKSIDNVPPKFSNDHNVAFHSGDDPVNLLDEYISPAIVEDTEDGLGMASTLAGRLLDAVHETDQATTDQMQVHQCAVPGQKRLSLGQSSGHEDLSVDVQYYSAAPVNEKKKLSQQPLQYMPLDVQSQKRTFEQICTRPELARQHMAVTHPSIVHHQNESNQNSATNTQIQRSRTKQQVSTELPTVYQSQQASIVKGCSERQERHSMLPEDPAMQYDRKHQFMMEQPAMNQNRKQLQTMVDKSTVHHNEPFRVKQPPMRQQRPTDRQKVTVQEQFLFEQPGWKTKSTVSQLPLQDRFSVMNTGLAGMVQPGRAWKALRNQEAALEELPRYQSLSQPGAGVQSAKTYLQGLSSDLQRPSKRVRLSDLKSPVKLSLQTSDDQFCVPPNGYSSDDVFAPKQIDEQVPIDSSIMNRLRGTETVEIDADSKGSSRKHINNHGQKPSELSDHRTASRQLADAATQTLPLLSRADISCQEESPEQVSGSNLWRKSLMNRRGQRPVNSLNDDEQVKGDGLQLYEGLSDVLQTIVTGVMRALKFKENGVYDVVKNYQTEAARIVHSIVATHAEERKQLITEHEQSRRSYIRVLKEARSKIQSIGVEVESFNISTIPIR